MSINPEIYFRHLHDVVMENSTLDVIERQAITCALHKSMNKLIIMKELFTGFKDIKYSGYKPIAFRAKSETKIEPEKQFPDNLLQSHRIYKYLSYTIDLFDETIAEINLQGIGAFLQYFLCCENLTSHDQLRLKEEYMENSKIFQFLTGKISEYTSNASIIHLYLFDIAGPCLEQAETNTWAQMKNFKHYTESKENSKIEENKLRLKQNTDSLQKSIDRFTNDFDEDLKTHLVVHGQISMEHTELVQKFEYWNDKYTTEIDNLDVELLQMRSKVEEQSELLEDIIEEVRIQNEHIKQLQDESEMRERAEQQKQMEYNAARKIQIWWRSILFWRMIRSKLKNKNTKSAKSGVNAKSKKQKKQK